MTREQVEGRLKAAKAVFWQAALYDSIDLGTIWSGVPSCASKAVSIQLKFIPPDASVAQPTDELSRVVVNYVGGECL